MRTVAPPGRRRVATNRTSGLVLSPGALPDTMRAAVYHGRRDVRVERVARPEPAAGELLVAVAAAGICGTDAHEYAAGPSMFPLDEPHPVTGHAGPLIIGHEFAGHVVAVGDDVDAVWLGRDIVCSAGYSCGTCRACRAGRTNLCARYASVGLQRHGGLAQYCAAPVAACEDVTDADLGSDVAALAQPAGIAMHALRRGRVAAGERTVIIGAGGIGAFLTAAAAAAGADVTVLDLDGERLAIADALGAHRTVQVGAEEPLAERLAGLDPEPDVLFEVTGVARVLEAVLSLRLRGPRVVVVGLQDGPLPVAFRPLALLEHELIGTNAMVKAVDLPAAVELLRRPGIDWSAVAPLVLALDELVSDGLEPLAAGTPARIKTLIDPWADRRRALGAGPAADRRVVHGAAREAAGSP
jgi:(R,R)-butanediol dehydrogenase / meso-butanediol dehydrogenase / diacetyl reductase